MRSYKRKKEHYVRIIALLVIILFCLLWVFNRQLIEENSDFVNITIAGLSLVIASLSAYFVVIQLRGERIIQEAEFLVNLNQTFTGDENYAKVYTELEKETQDNDLSPNLERIEISNYLTFFETIYILIKDDVIDISEINDLFSYRFFLAVHNKHVQSTKLVNEPGNFRNLYNLERLWMNYRLKNGLSVYRIDNCLERACIREKKVDEYLKLMGKKPIKLKYRELKAKDVDSIMDLQDKVYNSLSDKSLLRKNTKEMFESCVVDPNVSVGVYDGDKLVAVGIMVDARGTDEDLGVGLKKFEVQKNINFKNVMVLPEYRGLLLQLRLMVYLEEKAKKMGYTHSCTSISPDNFYSRSNALKMGYLYDHSAEKYGGLKRDIFVKEFTKEN